MTNIDQPCFLCEENQATKLFIGYIEDSLEFVSFPICNGCDLCAQNDIMLLAQITRKQIVQNEEQIKQIKAEIAQIKRQMKKTKH